MGAIFARLKQRGAKEVLGKKIIRIYPFRNVLKLRNQISMKVQADSEDIDVKKGVKGHSIISILPQLDISTCIVPEYMHSVLLGVVKQFLNIWLNKKGPWKINKHTDKIDSFLKNIKLPHKFGRYPRSLKNLHTFKATEFYNFLIYYSMPALNNYLPKPFLDHWILLVSSIYKLLKEKIHVQHDLKNAEECLKLFVYKVKELYGEHEMTYNLHQLLHLGLIVKRWGPLWATSAFMFENEIGVLAKKVHGKNNLGQELINNLQIVQAAYSFKVLKSAPEVLLKNHFMALGKTIRPTINKEENQCFLLENIMFENIKIFSRAEINKVLYTSMSYKIIGTNDYTIMVNENDSYKKYGSVRFFFIYDENNYLILKQFQIDRKKMFINSVTGSIVEHILPLQEINSYSIIKIENISYIKHVVRVGNFICLPPNFYNVVF